MLSKHASAAILRKFGLRDGGQWNKGLTEVVPLQQLREMATTDWCIQLASSNTFFFTKSKAYNIDEPLLNTLKAIFKLAKVAHPICVWQTEHPHGEQCFQFEAGPALIFVHSSSFLPPYEGVIHEYVHGLGLTGVPVVDEGLATLFEAAAGEAALKCSDQTMFDVSWVNTYSRRPFSKGNIHYIGAVYFAAFLVAHSENELWGERDRLAALEDGKVAMKQMGEKLIEWRKKQYQNQANSYPTFGYKGLDVLYFAGQFDDYLPAATRYFSTRENSAMQEAEQLTLGRYLIFIATLDEEIAVDFKHFPIVEGDIPDTLGLVASLLAEIAHLLRCVRASSTRRSLIRNAAQLYAFLTKHEKHPTVGPDVLLQLVQFHRYTPKVAGGDVEAAKKYAEKLSLIPNMASTGLRLMASLSGSH